MFSLIAALPQMRQALALRATNMRDLPSPPRYQRPEWTALGRQMFPNLNIEEWEIDSCLRLEGFEAGDWQVLAQWSDGTPLLLMRRHGNGTVVLSLAGQLPEGNRSWTQELFFGVLGIRESGQPVPNTLASARGQRVRKNRPAQYPLPLLERAI
jgi:hypothetical protein